MEDAISQMSRVTIDPIIHQSPDESVLPSIQPQDESPLKEDTTLEKLLSELLLKSGENPEYVNDFLFLKGKRDEVNGILSLVGGPEYDNVESSSTNKILRGLKHLAESREKILKECNRGWHPSVCYPLPCESVCDMHLPDHLHAVYDKIDCPVLYGRGIHLRAIPDVIPDVAIPDVVSLLSLDGGAEPTLVDRTGKVIVVVKPGTFKDKYVLVFCVNAPVVYGSEFCQSLLNLCNELDLYSESEEIEIVTVMVARMNILADTKEVFDHLFSGFPKSSLAVPYGDRERREAVWKRLMGNSFAIRCSVYNTNGEFLTSFCFDFYKRPYGAEAFPFDKDMFEKTDKERKRLRKEGSLEELLRPYESSKDVFVRELNRSDEEKKRISEVIKGKHVGLYLCCECDSPLAPRVQKLYEQQCKIKGQEFEIVVLFVPLLSEIDPELIQAKIESLWVQQNIRGWWCLPFNNSVSLRFWGLTKDADTGFHSDVWEEDKLIIVGPDGTILDMYGAQVIQRRNWLDAYPFTRKAYVQSVVKRQLNELGLGSLLVDKLVRGNDAITAQDLFSMQKRIIIILGNPYDHNVKWLVPWYSDADRSKFEVVFIVFPPYKGGEGGEEDAEMPPWVTDMPWYCHRPLDRMIGKKMREFVCLESLVGFGEDGLICSLKRLDELNRDEAWKWEPCLEDTLCDDVYRLFMFHEYADI